VPISVPHLKWNRCDYIAIRLPAEMGKSPYFVEVSAHHLRLSDTVEMARATTHMQGVPGFEVQIRQPNHSPTELKDPKALLEEPASRSHTVAFVEPPTSGNRPLWRWKPGGNSVTTTAAFASFCQRRVGAVAGFTFCPLAGVRATLPRRSGSCHLPTVPARSARAVGRPAPDEFPARNT
jgi:hypothetical protein